MQFITVDQIYSTAYNTVMLDNCITIAKNMGKVIAKGK